ncbi:MAG: hypothetical protein RL717_1078, partial [Pseudomonadota bacterium]
MATVTPARTASGNNESIFSWEGKDKNGRPVQGELRASGVASVAVALRRQGISVGQVKKKRFASGKKITEKDICFFTRQLATMLKAGVPLLQSFDIVARGHANAAVSRLLQDIRADVETGTSLNQA